MTTAYLPSNSLCLSDADGKESPVTKVAEFLAILGPSFMKKLAIRQLECRS